MIVERVLAVGNMGVRERGVDFTRHLTSAERISLLEDLRCELARMRNDEYPQRLRRVLAVTRELAR